MVGVFEDFAGEVVVVVEPEGVGAGEFGEEACLGVVL